MKMTRFVGTVMLSMLAFAGGGCDDSSGPEDEVHGTILTKDLILSTVTLTDNMVYMITGETEFEDDLVGLHDPRLVAGTHIEIDYFHDNGMHVAAEIELDND